MWGHFGFLWVVVVLVLCAADWRISRAAAQVVTPPPTVPDPKARRAPQGAAKPRRLHALVRLPSPSLLKKSILYEQSK